MKRERERERERERKGESDCHTAPIPLVLFLLFRLLPQLPVSEKAAVAFKCPDVFFFVVEPD